MAARWRLTAAAGVVGITGGGLYLADPYALPAAHAQAAPQSRAMLDYMVMDVCVDANDRILPARIPGDAQCPRRRDIRAGEAAPYTLQNFGYPGGPCDGAGTIDKNNVPVARNGITRIVSTTIRRPGCSARATSRSGTDPGSDATPQDGASIQWADDQYGFIMGSYSPVSLSAFQSSLCLQNPKSSRRFFRSWVIAPARLPALGSGSVGTFDGAMARGAAQVAMNACPPRFRKSLTSWTVQPFAFKSGRRLAAVISSHFAQTAPDGQSPGNAMQVERTYWTSEFGLTRWEKWTRDDYDRKDGKSLATIAGQLVKRGRCSKPSLPPVAYSRAMRETAGQAKDMYDLRIANPVTGEQHRWVMTLCEDYSNIQPASSDSRQVPPTALASKIYWLP